MNFKETIYRHYTKLIEEKIQLLQTTLQDLRLSAANETKSTAGDKHETALAMLQIEQENTAKQLNEALAQKKTMDQIDATIKTIQVCKGSLVKTNHGLFFISSALGKKEIDGVWVIAISPASPLGNKMMGLQQGDRFAFNQTNYRIEELY